MAAMFGATLVLLTGHTGRGTAAGFAVVAVATGALPRRSDPSLTGTIASAITLLAYWAGAYIGRDEWPIVGAIAAGVAILVTSARYVETRFRGVAPDDAGAALEFGVVATLLFFLLPAANFGPWGVMNPRQLWGLVVLVSSLSFVVFVCRALGRARADCTSGRFSAGSSQVPQSPSPTQISREGRATAVLSGLAQASHRSRCSYAWECWHRSPAPRCLSRSYGFLPPRSQAAASSRCG